MAYIGQQPSAVITTTAQIQDGAVELVDISAAAQASLGTVDFYGFKKLADGTLQLDYSNGSDNLSTANNDSTQTDIYAESFVSKRGLSFSVDSSGNLTVTI
tara:strand:+ start:426 stop:728 length:303 start_codon:yes stop_codon:yes gene_type:complete